MKRCPTCSRSYADDQNFCLEDGTTLVAERGGSFDSADAPTMNYPYHSGSPPTGAIHGTPTTSGRPIGTSPPPYLTPYPPKRSAVPWIVGGLFVVIVGVVVAVLLANRKTETPVSVMDPKSGSSPTYTPAPTSTPYTSSSSWQAVNGDRFTFSMPGSPSHDEQTISSAAGPLPLHMYTLSEGYEGFIAGYTEYPDYIFTSAGPEDLLDGAQQGAVSNVEGQVTSQKKISIAGNPGREIVGTSPSRNIGFTARVYLVRPRMYMFVYTQYDKDKPISSDGTRFLDSFQITN